MSWTKPRVGAKLKMKYITLIAIVLSFESFGQSKISKTDLRGEWFTANTDSAFFTADTIQLIKRTNKELRDDVREIQKFYIEPVTELVKANDYVNLEFKNRKHFEFWESTNGGAINALWTTPMKWKLKDDTVTITSDKFKWEFHVISVYGDEKIEFDYLVSNYPKNQYKTLVTPAIKLKRINN